MIDPEPILDLVPLDEEEADVVVRDAVAAAHRNVTEALRGVCAGRKYYRIHLENSNQSNLPMMLPKPFGTIESKIANVIVTANNMTCA